VTIELRPIREGDVASVVELVAASLGEFGLEFGKGTTTDDELYGLPDSYASRGGAFWVAIADDAVVGTCGMFPVAAESFELRKMYLAPSARGLGVGKGLLDVAVAWARARGGRRIVLDTIERMTRAIAFYEAHGFTRDDTQISGARCTRGYVMDL
jgi:putative acetyltransferase